MSDFLSELGTRDLVRFRVAVKALFATRPDSGNLISVP